jgi:hypothetical protein
MIKEALRRARDCGCIDSGLDANREEHWPGSANTDGRPMARNASYCSI